MKKAILYSIAVLFAAFTSCKKDTNAPLPENPKEGLTKVAEAYALGTSTKVEVWSQAELGTGYNKLFIALYDSVSKQPVNKASLQIMPMMTMNINGSSMVHSAPFENPENELAENTLFPCAAVFTMPGSTEDEKWQLDVMVKKDGQSKYSKAELPLNVKQSQPERVKTINAADGSNITVSFLPPLKPKVGVNDFEIIVHSRQNMLFFPAANDYTLVITPEMPSMGHGSPNNVNPVLVQNGHYKGKVNFTMTGEWKINLDLIKDNKTVATFFDVSF